MIYESVNTLCYDFAAHVAPDSLFRSLTHKIPPNLGSTTHQASGDMECSHRHGFSSRSPALEATTMTPTRALAIACTPSNQLGLGIKLVRCCRLPLHRRLPPQTVRASVTPGHGPYIAWIRRGHNLFIPIGITQDYIRQ